MGVMKFISKRARGMKAIGQKVHHVRLIHFIACLTRITFH